MIEKKERFERFWTMKRVEKILLTLMGMLFFCILLYSALKPASHDTIVFNVTGITSNINASTLVVIHFECIKYCIDHVGEEIRNLCYEQCTKLGTEGCHG